MGGSRGSPIAGWFISWKLPKKNGRFRGTSMTQETFTWGNPCHALRSGLFAEDLRLEMQE